MKDYVRGYLNLKERADSARLLLLASSIVGGLALEQPQKPIIYIKNRLLDIQKQQGDALLHEETFCWPHHPILRKSKQLVCDESHEISRRRFIYRIKQMESRSLPIEEDDILALTEGSDFASVFRLTELSFS
ncbi:unnamed protein product [Calicophoron daubneyi]|uniref:Uncharacterized protein n=1 Tax=Calicophoron daubneyi TaxID=300641 RepID=A0AAV2T5X5_CALDB